MVAADPALTSAFAQGVSGAVERVRALGTDEATSFLEAFDDFLDRFGHRGPNEVELASSTWGTAPDTALAVVERLRLTAAAADPEVAARRLGEERRAARERLLHAVLPPLRPVVRRMLDTGARGTARREQAKGTLVLGIHGLRVALVTAADRLVAAGSLPDRTALFMATVDELSTLLSDPESLRDELADRRARYEDLDARVPPFSFVGRIPPPATWPLRSARLAGQRPLSYSGIGVSGGIARGRARVVIDPSDPRGIEPGEVLVAPLTDPAWTPLFLAAAAVVVDVGAMQSHAAIVARELGVPAVVSVEGASGSIADGDLLEVDGNRGLVTVLEETGGASAAPPRSGAPGGAGARP
jgi:pyruvate,water dikinase